MKIVWVKWQDAHGQEGPVNQEDVDRQDSLVVVSAGMYVSENENVIRLSMDFYNYEGFTEKILRNTLVIPKKNIIGMKIFNVPDYGGNK